MGNKRKSFLLHIDSLEILDDLDNDQVADLFRAIKAFQKGEDYDLDKVVKMVFLPFKNQFVRDNEKYEKTCKARAAAGSKGGRKRVANQANASKCKQDLANQADNKNKNKNKSDSDSKNKTLLDGFEFWWSLYPSERRSSKQKCFDKWKSICKKQSPDEIENLVNKISDDIAGRISKVDDIKYIPLTPTYLNNERWNDGQ